MHGRVNACSYPGRFRQSPRIRIFNTLFYASSTLQPAFCPVGYFFKDMRVILATTNYYFFVVVGIVAINIIVYFSGVRTYTHSAPIFRNIFSVLLISPPSPNFKRHLDVRNNTWECEPMRLQATTQDSSPSHSPWVKPNAIADLLHFASKKTCVVILTFSGSAGSTQAVFPVAGSIMRYA